MPKTNLYPHPLPNQPDGADSRIEVGWHEYAVQIATTKLLPSDSENEPAARAWAGQFVDLDRDQINHLIRTLREARDRAFGRDE